MLVYRSPEAEGLLPRCADGRAEGRWAGRQASAAGVSPPLLPLAGPRASITTDAGVGAHSLCARLPLVPHRGRGSRAPRGAVPYGLGGELVSALGEDRVGGKEGRKERRLRWVEGRPQGAGEGQGAWCRSLTPSWLSPQDLRVL